MQLKTLATNFINLFTVIVEGFLLLRFALKLFGANAQNGFVDWVYDMSAVLLSPFRGIFPTTVFENQFVLEFSTLFAMLMYLIIGLLLLALVAAIPGDETTPVKKKR